MLMSVYIQNCYITLYKKTMIGQGGSIPDAHPELFGRGGVAVPEAMFHFKSYIMKMRLYI